MNFILNKTKNAKERWRIIAGGLGFQGSEEDSPLRKFRIAKGVFHKNLDCYTQEMSIDVFFKESDAPDSVKKIAMDWLRTNGYAVWLCKNINIKYKTEQLAGQHEGECWQCFCVRNGWQHTNGPCRCTKSYLERRRNESL